MNKATPSAIRLSVTGDISRALIKAKRLYPTLSDAEILKLGLSKIVTEIDGGTSGRERDDVRTASARSVGEDYPSDTAEDL